VTDPFAIGGFDLESAIRAAADAQRTSLSANGLRALAAHARAVLGDDEDRHLTSIREPGTFVERHLAEGFAGAAILDPAVEGVLLDMGSGNGYPGLVVAAACPGLRPLLVEASKRKAEFLNQVLANDGFPGGHVLHAQVQRPSDLRDTPPIRVVVTRAMGNWERILPRLVPALSPDADVLVWSGAETGDLTGRASWKRLDCVGRRALPGRDRTWVWHFRPVIT